MPIIKSLIENYNTNLYNKPKYKIQDLYCARIVKYNSSKMVDWVKFDYDTTPVKEFAILQKVKSKHGTPIYIHIKSGKPLTRVCYATIGDYAIDNVAPFKKQLNNVMLQEGYTIDTKLSKNIIDHIESEYNLLLTPNQEETEMFGI